MNYNTLMNKPTINYRELIGDNTVTEVGGITEEQFNTLLTTDLSSYYTKEQIDDLFSRSYVYREKSGSIVTFDCPASVNCIDKVVSEIVAVQSGTGDPSPTNVRPISGWSAVNRYRTGKNRITSITEGIELTATTGTTRPNSSWYVTDYTRVEYGKTYYLSGTSSYIVCYYDKTKTFTRYTLSSSTITPQEGEYYVRCNSSISGYSEPQIEEGTEATSFSPFGTTYTTALKDGQGNPMTCYGGTLSNENGVQTLDNTYGYVEFDGSNDESWSFTQNYSEGIDRFSIAIATAKANAQTLENWLSNIRLAQVGHGYINQNSVFLAFFEAGQFNSVADFKTYLSNKNLQVMYELATPIIIPQDNLPISTQEGVNNIWADSGDITVKALDKILQG